MKHTEKQAKKAKRVLIDYHNYKESDFYFDDTIRMNCKDNVGISAFDFVENLQFLGEKQNKTEESLENNKNSYTFVL